MESCDEYEYQIDTSSSFNSTELQTGTPDFISSNADNADTEIQTSGLIHGQKYYWRVRARTNAIPTVWSDIWSFTVSETGVGFEQMLDNNFLNLRVIPNPVKSNGWINFNCKPNQVIRISVYNILGDEVRHLFSGISATGNQSMPFNTHGLSSGVYFIKLDSEFTSAYSKFIVK